METKSEFTHRYCWLNILDGTFSNPWTEEEHIKAAVAEMTVADHFKIMKFECVNDPKFEFNRLMRLR